MSEEIKYLLYVVWFVIIVVVVLYLYLWQYVKWGAQTLIIVTSQKYFCGYDLFRLVERQFFIRFGQYNKEGFCYTVSAAYMLALREFKSARVVRGRITKGEFDSFHSWTEVKLYGRWWVVDPTFLPLGFATRSLYYRRNHPKILVIYKYKAFWADPAAEKFYERLQAPLTSHIFVELYWHYTPKGQDWVAIENMTDAKISFPDEGEYQMFPAAYGYKYSQGIVRDFMARPARKSPRRRTLRRLAKQYRCIERKIAAEKAKASATNQDVAEAGA